MRARAWSINGQRSSGAPGGHPYPGEGLERLIVPVQHTSTFSEPARHGTPFRELAMLLDEFFPVYDVVERHQRDIHAPVERVYAAVRHFDLSRSAVIRWLFRLRGLPAASLRLDGLLHLGFV